MNNHKVEFTEQQENDMCELYKAGNSLDKVAKQFDTYSFRVKRILHERGVRKYPLCENGCPRIQYARGLCQRCYFHIQQAEQSGVKKKAVKDPLVDCKDTGIQSMYRSNMSLNAIQKVTRLAVYKIKQILSDAGLLDAPRCITEGCNNVQDTKGYCKSCYNRIKNIAKKAKKGEVSEADEQMTLEALEQDLASKTTEYNCCTMAVPIQRRVFLRNEILAVSAEIQKLKG